jgi:hypothetical protein
VVPELSRNTKVPKRAPSALEASVPHAYALPRNACGPLPLGGGPHLAASISRSPAAERCVDPADSAHTLPIDRGISFLRGDIGVIKISLSIGAGMTPDKW